MKRELTTESLLLRELSLMYPDSSTTTLRKMLAADRVRVNGELVRDAKRALRNGDVIAIDAKPSTRSLHSSLTLLHEDEWLLVIIKSAGLLTVASRTEVGIPLSEHGGVIEFDGDDATHHRSGKGHLRRGTCAAENRHE